MLLANNCTDLIKKVKINEYKLVNKTKVQLSSKFTQTTAKTQQSNAKEVKQQFYLLVMAKHLGV